MEFLQSLSETSFLTWVRESESILAYPTVLFLHSLGMATLVGFLSVIDVRLIGVASTTPVSPLRRLIPFAWIGFWLSAASGTLLFLIDPAKLRNPVFWTKLAFIGVATYSGRLIERQVLSDPGIDAKPLSSRAKALGAVSLACWLGAITAGRLMAYFGNVR
jgi:hypothetical protein